VLNGNGEVTRVLSGLGLSGADLRLALVEAGHGQAGVLTDRFRLLCFGYDRVRGTYTARIGVLLKIAAVLTLAAMAGVDELFWLLVAFSTLIVPADRAYSNLHGAPSHLVKDDPIGP
jgi:hypothetical protein